MLMEHGCVAVREIGTFYLRKISAKFNENRQVLYPPSTGVYFSPNVDKDFEFSALLIESGLTREEAALLEKLISEDYKIAVQKNEAFELDQLGTISNDTFTEKEKHTFNRYVGLKDLNVKVMSGQNITHDENFEYYLQQNVSDKKESWQHYIGPALIALLTALCILLWFLSDSKPQKTEPVSNITVDSPKLSATDSIYQEIDNVLIENELKSEKSKPSESKEPQNTFTPPLSKEKVESSVSKECIVIVGAFIEKDNAKRMVKRIRSKGYTPYESEHDGKIRVGVKYDCAMYQPDDYKEKIKKFFNPEAWHLHDTL